MTVTVSKSKLKAHVLRLLRELEENGEEIIVTDRDRPVARVIPYQPKLSVEEVFADIYGQIEFLEDPDTPTKSDDWEDL